MKMIFIFLTFVSLKYVINVWVILFHPDRKKFPLYNDLRHEWYLVLVPDMFTKI